MDENMKVATNWCVYLNVKSWIFVTVYRLHLKTGDVANDKTILNDVSIIQISVLCQQFHKVGSTLGNWPRQLWRSKRVRSGIGTSRELSFIKQWNSENRRNHGSRYRIRWLATSRRIGSFKPSSRQRKFVTNNIVLTVEKRSSFVFVGNLEVASVAAICVGLVNVGSTNPEASTCILQKLLELSPLELANTYARLVAAIYLLRVIYIQYTLTL